MRQRNGWTDTGKALRGTEGTPCPNCGSSQYRETVSREYCPACGLECDYWGGGANAVYEAHHQRYQARLEAARREEFRRIYGDDEAQLAYGDDDD